MGYLTNFIVYTMAMVGVLGIAILIFKNSTGVGGKSSTKNIKVLDSLNLAPRKTLYIVSAGSEKFLIASDVDKTTLISKLNTERCYQENIPAVITSDVKDYSTKSFSETMNSLPKEDYMDMTTKDLRKRVRKSMGIKDESNAAVMKNLARKMSTIGSREE